jgi:pyruvate dehydrogenase E2 component (dihydrolipoamide acetyltransferase)
MAEFTMPSLGADMDAGTLVEWLVAPGDVVERGQIVAVVETQKGAIDVEIFEPGEILELVTPVGEKVPVGTTLALVRGEGETEEQVRAAWAARQSGAPPAGEREEAEPAKPEPGVVEAPAAGERGGRRISPRARKLAAKLGLDRATLEQLRGTGPGGAITGEDVESAARARPSRPSAVATSGMREAIGAAMARSKREIPHYYLDHTVDLEPALTWLEAQNEGRGIDERLLPITVLVRALARALTKHPEFSGFWRDGGFVPGEGVHVGLAVSLRGGGLVNPALCDADHSDLDALNRAILELANRTRKGELRASDFERATITATNLGDRGVDRVFGVIVPPQVAIVGFGTVRRRPWVVGEDILARRLVDISLAADHRVSDGHAGARFLARIDKLLQAPESL